MASEVSIANLALAHLGDRATVSSLSPPEGSEQAEKCAAFLPLARDELLERHPWSFSTRRAGPLAQLASSVAGATDPAWPYAFALPAGSLKVWSVVALGASDDTFGVSGADTGWGDVPPIGYAPIEFETETIDSGEMILRTREPSVRVRYSVRVTNPDRWSPLFVSALSWQLASYLAGPIIKGEAGRKVGERCLGMADRIFGQAASSDAQQMRRTNNPVTGWIAGR